MFLNVIQAKFKLTQDQPASHQTLIQLSYWDSAAMANFIMLNATLVPIAGSSQVGMENLSWFIHS